MNPGKLKNKLTFYETVFESSQENLTEVCKAFGEMKFKNNKQADQQNVKSYYITIRKNNKIKPNMKAETSGRWFDIQTIEEPFPGYMQLECSLGYVHNLTDTCEVFRDVETETDYGETKMEPMRILEDVPCELIKVDSGNSTQTETTHDIRFLYKVQMETHRNTKIGDSLEVNHRGEVFRLTVKEYFKYHTFQELIVELEGEA